MPWTPEQHLRYLGKVVTIAATLGTIIFCVNRLDGPAEAWSVIGAIVSAPIIYHLLIGPLKLLLKIIGFIFFLTAIVATVGVIIMFVLAVIQATH